MHELPLAEKVARMLPFLERAGLVRAARSTPTAAAEGGPLVEALGDRLKVFGDIVLQAGFFFGQDVAYDDKAFAKRVLAPGAADRLADYRAWLAGRDPPSTPPALEARDPGLPDRAQAWPSATSSTPSGSRSPERPPARASSTAWP